ncbi:hypothetical protein HMPREF9696_01798 [Afipia clevelandensis ATCC 49720]|uniref:Uncharacterized protein n=1 Tax=Afipia clevelandensis ATCC 49720 TaxID=883079 RepID=K8PHM6_9BRAD|nr:hypothetical protein HMPREF9696_01798 [Afipia clevelandensis ATCC 49720]
MPHHSRASIVRGELSLCPSTMRGMERREAQMSCFASGIACEAMLVRKRIASRRSIRGDFGRGDRTSGWDGRTLIRSAFAAFISISCSRERQSHVVGPDGDPADERGSSRLPDATGANRARRRRILLRFKAPSRSAPREQDNTDYIPRMENVKSASSLRGAKRRSNPFSLSAGSRWIASLRSQ